MRGMTGNQVPTGYAEAPPGDDFDDNLEGAIHAPRQGELHWSSGICACFDDVPACCLGCWCPCVLFGQNVETLEGKPCVGPCILHFLLWSAVTAGCCFLTQGTAVGLVASCVPCYACNYRKAIRAKYNLEDAPCGDPLTHACYHMCANCQEYRELKERVAPDHGLYVNMPPPVQSMVDPDSERSDPNELNDFPK